uniref:STAS domain-containing protein n=1 Tax=Panagrellus redivivus TaxID=6233 RepID=A0A7E4W8E2_PANRE
MVCPFVCDFNVLQRLLIRVNCKVRIIAIDYHGLTNMLEKLQLCGTCILFEGNSWIFKEFIQKESLARIVYSMP